MILKELSFLFNKALLKAFDLKKFVSLFLVLVMSGFIFLFFQGIGLPLPFWFKLLLYYVPFYLIIAFLMCAGIVLVKGYDQESKGENTSLTDLMKSSSDLFAKASFLVLPLLGAFMGFWVLLGVFALLKSIPYLGMILGVMLAFVPFLLQAGIFLTLIGGLFLLFFAVPDLAITGSFDWKAFLKRFGRDPFSHLLFLGVAFLFVWLIYFILFGAGWAIFQTYSIDDPPLAVVLQSFFVLFPFVGILTPFIIFFFHFACEARSFLMSTE